MTTHRKAVAMSLASGLFVCGLTTPVRADEGQFTVGSQWWSQTNPEAKFQEFREVPRGGLLEDFLWSTWSGRNTLTLWGVNGLRTDQATRLTLANGVKWRMDLGYQEIPHTFSQVARSPYNQGTPGWWMLPDSLQAKNQRTPATYTPTMTDLLANAPRIPLGFGTNLSTARLRARPAKGWQFEARGTTRQRSGQKSYAMTFGFSTAIEIPEPINQRTVDGDLIANYQHDSFKAQAIAGVSTFENRVSTLLVDNPKRLTDVAGGDGPKVGALDLYPDNRVIRGTLALGYLMPRRTALAATLGMSHNTQDDPFLKPTNNRALAQSTLDSLPARSLGGSVDQISADVRLTTRPLDKLDGAVRFNYKKYDSKTESLTFTGQSPYDVSWQRWIDLRNEPANNSQWVGGADLDYALSRGIRLGGTAEYRVRERTEREIEKDTETVLSARARLRPMDALQIDGRIWHGDRKQDGFLDEDYLGFRLRQSGPSAGVYDSLAQVEQPDLRRFDVADRVQDKVTGGVSYAIGERADLSASYAYLNNDYPESKLGLEDEKQHTVAASGTFHMNDRFDLNGGYGFQWMRTNQASRTSPASVTSVVDSNWTAELTDNDTYLQTGFEWEMRPGKVTLVGDYQFSRHLAVFHFTNGTNRAQDVPSTIYRLHQAAIEARYHWRPRTTVSARYGWEEYDTNDWATVYVPLIFPVTGTANAIFLGDSSTGYRAHRIAVVLRHNF